MSIIIVLLILTATGYYFFIRTHPSKVKNSSRNSPAKNQQKENLKKEFRGVVIKQSTNACNAAKAFGKTPILMNEAPALPLPTCNQENCQCSFLKYSDRRRGGRRTSLSVARQQIGGEDENRSRGNRRK